MKTIRGDKRRMVRKSFAVCLAWVMITTLLQGFMIPAKAEGLPIYDTLFSYDGRAYIYEGESITLKGINSKIQWSCSDVEQQYCTWKTNGGKSNTTGSEMVLTGKSGSVEGYEVTVHAEMEGYGYKEITIKIKQNDKFWYEKGNEKITNDSVDVTVEGNIKLKTNQNQDIAFANDNGYIEYSAKNPDGYEIRAKSETTNPSKPIVLSSTYTFEEDGFSHTIHLTLDLHVIDTLKINESNITMEKGTKDNPGTYELTATPTNKVNTIEWRIFKGKLTADETISNPEAEITEDYFKIIPSSSGSYSKLNDKATISITDELVLSKNKNERIYTIIATQKVYGERYMNSICYVTVNQPVTQLKLSMTEKTVFLVGEGEKGETTSSVTAMLSGDAENGIAPDNEAVTWECTDPDVATIRASGTSCQIEAQRPGHCVIVASSKDNPAASDVLYIEVAPKVSTVEITNTDMTVNLAEQHVQLFANVQSNSVDEKKETEEYDRYMSALNTNTYWSSNRPDIAEVDMYTGKVTLKAAGRVTITCTSADDQYVSDSIVLTVNVPVASVDLYYNYKKISVGESFTLDYTLRSAYKDYEPSNKEVTWESSDNKVASVDNDGKVTGLSGGTATILVRADDGQITATCTVEVYQAVSRIDISETTMDLNLGEESILEASVYPSTASEQKILWSSNKPDVVSVTPDGVLSAKKVGDPVVITAYIIDKNATIKTTCVVNVVVPVTSLSLSPDSKIMEKGDSILLTKKITPDNATNTTVIYASTNTAVATVDENGNVQAVSGGSCYITARTKNRDIMTSVYVTVKENITGIKLNRTSKVMKKGVKYQLKASIMNSSATNKELVWSSSNKKVASVSGKGMVTAKKPGKAVISCLSTDGSGKKAQCRITVKQNVTNITLNRTSLTLGENESYQLKATVKPTNAANKKVQWSSTNEQVASVSGGKVKAKGAGTCYISCKAKDGSAVAARCRIKVTRKKSNSHITATENK